MAMQHCITDMPPVNQSRLTVGGQTSDRIILSISHGKQKLPGWEGSRDAGQVASMIRDASIEIVRPTTALRFFQISTARRRSANKLLPASPSKDNRGHLSQS